MYLYLFYLNIFYLYLTVQLYRTIKITFIRSNAMLYIIKFKHVYILLHLRYI